MIRLSRLPRSAFATPRAERVRPEAPVDRLAELKAKNASLYDYIVADRIAKGVAPEFAHAAAARLVPGPRA